MEPPTLQALSAASLINSNLIAFPLSRNTLPLHLAEELWFLTHLHQLIKKKLNLLIHLNAIHVQLFDTIEQERIAEMRWDIRKTQFQESEENQNPPVPPPMSLFIIHHRAYYWRKISIVMYNWCVRTDEKSMEVDSKLISHMKNLPVQYHNFTFQVQTENIADDEDSSFGKQILQLTQLCEDIM